MKTRAWLFITLVLTTTVLFSASKTGTTAAQFLKIGVGSRAAGMGSAYAAVANDASAIFWNPAGLARMNHSEAILAHSEWLADIKYDFGGVVINMGNMGMIGASLTILSMGDMLVRTESEPEGTGEYFSASDACVALTYSRSLTDRFSIGMNVKYIRQGIYHMNANGFAFDVGTLFTTQFNGMRIGMNIANFGSKMRMSGKDAKIYVDINNDATGSNSTLPAHLETSSWPLPLLFRVGVAMEPLKTKRHRITTALDALHPNDNSERINAGVEYSFREMVALRAGYQSAWGLDAEDGLTFGGGLYYSMAGMMAIKLDYAYADWGRLANAQRLSLGIEF
jgi:long-subunit fatty acid transport protein